MESSLRVGSRALSGLSGIWASSPGIPKAIDQPVRDDPEDRRPHSVIHGERDTLVPLKEAEELYRHLGTKEKELVIIPGATHNDIFYVGFQKYFEAIQRFVLKTDRTKVANR
jgi:alpha-beta hydrolase superfamily lysophospholipase